jgi:hydrogenase maturation protease
MGGSTDPALIVFAWGNESRGDDGIGPAFAGYLHDLADPRIEIVEDFQLNIEHVTDFRGQTPLLFVDASVAIESGFEVEQVVPSQDANFSTHAISPQALLNVYQQTTSEAYPPAYLLHIAARSFTLGDALGSTALEALGEAREFFAGLISSPATTWSEKLAAAAALRG